MRHSLLVPALLEVSDRLTKRIISFQRNNGFLLLISILFLTAIQLSAGAETIRYVKMGSAGDGSSWAAASGNTTLQAIIDASSAGDQVWVTGGTYQPAAGSSFSMKEGVKIYGGFGGSEATLSQRDLSMAGNKSVLQEMVHRLSGTITIASQMRLFWTALP